MGVLAGDTRLALLRDDALYRLGYDRRLVGRLFRPPSRKGGVSVSLDASIRIYCDRLSCRIGGEPALRCITHTFERGITYVVGKAGSGKSTLLSLLATVGPVCEGNIRYERRDAAAVTCADDGINNVILDYADVRAMTGYLPQQFAGYPDMTVERYLRHEADRKGMPLGWSRTALPRLIAESGIAALKRRRMRLLSGGERRKIGLLQAIMHAPRLCVLDEPFEGLDVLESAYFRHELEKLSAYSTVVIATHRLEQIDPRADCSLLLLEQGKIAFVGTGRNKDGLPFD
jgi:ABC-type multidrug transport system ATPase subunit